MQQFVKDESDSTRRRLLFRVFNSVTGLVKTGQTFSAGDLKWSKNGGAEANTANHGSVVELTDGMYYYPASQGELDTIGPVYLRVAKAACRTVVIVARVDPRPPYIAAAVSDASPAAGDFDTDLASATNSFYNDAFCLFITGSLAGQVRKVTGYTGSTKNLQFSGAFTAAPANGDKFVLVNN